MDWNLWVEWLHRLPVHERLPAKSLFVQGCFIDTAKIPGQFLGHAEMYQPAVNMQGIQHVPDPVLGCEIAVSFHKSTVCLLRHECFALRIARSRPFIWHEKYAIISIR
jgi:hypothetical protein